MQFPNWMQFANILFNDFYLFLFIFRFYCLPVCLLFSQFFVFQRNPFRVTSRCSIVSGHNGVGGRGATLCQKEDTQQFSQPEYCRLRKKALPSPQCDSLSRGKLVLVHRNPILPYLVLRSSRRLLTTVSVDSQLETIVSLTFWLSQGML